VRANPRPAKPATTDVLLDVGVYEVRQPDAGQAGEVVLKPVTERAVVCDLCAALPAGPACVRACPHDAAMRIDGRTELAQR
jgi:Fe-S-cluster-containing hydrogenase component 2